MLCFLPGGEVLYIAGHTDGEDADWPDWEELPESLILRVEPGQREPVVVGQLELLSVFGLFVTDTDKIYMFTSDLKIWTFNPGDTHPVGVLNLDNRLKPQALLVHEEALYVLDYTGKVFLVLGDYQPANSALNGAENDRAIVSVRSGTSLQLEIRLLGAAATEDPGETRSPLDLDSFVCVEASTGDVSAESGLKAVVFANGTSIAKNQVHQLPAIPAPCLRFAGSSAQLTLRADTGDATFRLAMFSPEVQAFHEVAAPDHTDLQQPGLGLQVHSESREPRDVTSFGKKMRRGETGRRAENGEVASDHGIVGVDIIY
eukprot:s4528_g5.t1